MSSSSCCFLTGIQVSQKAGKVVWYSRLFKNFPQFVVIYTVKSFSIVNEAEVDFFLEFLCFFLWSNGCWKFHPWFLCIFYIQLVHLDVFQMLKPSLNDFEHYLAIMWNECICAGVWIIFSVAFLWGWKWKLTFSSLMAADEFSQFAGILNAAF